MLVELTSEQVGVLARGKNAWKTHGKRLEVRMENAWRTHARACKESASGNVPRVFLTRTRPHSQPNFTEAWLSLARLEEEAGRLDNARRYYATICHVRTGAGRHRVELWQSWARMEQAAGNEHNAVVIYARASVLFENDVELW